MSDYTHPPGHPQAVTDGCTCPVLDNAHGKGCGYLTPTGEPVYIFDFACPLHGEAEPFGNSDTFARDLTEQAYGAAARITERIA